ncbi:MFS transporter [Pelagibacterium sp. H642]|uniref:MFS transporter n=1 Tax=Pelagibacterium sp. H642 TaxID=1881069 RepID=UPI002815C159|nr:MFS transporter [Pelagibacterium sp. H642]WMT92619.1 MFS transporter [Pelagibacterium sp. H642]
MTTKFDGLVPPHRPSIALHAISLVAFLAASAAPTPLYRLYQEMWGFSPFLLTVVFAVYAQALLVALLCFGSLSDRFGRRPVIIGALLLQAGALILFLAAKDVVWLVAARLLQGFSTGLATASLGAALIDIDRERGAFVGSVAPMAGMGLGALGGGLLAQFAPAPLHLVYLLLLAVFLMQLLRTARSPETAVECVRHAWNWRPRIAVPAAARRALLIVTPINVAAWALGGFYLSLMPSLLKEVAGSDATWMGGLTVAALTVSGATAILFARRHSAHASLIAGSTALIIGMCMILSGVALSLPLALLLGSMVAGLGFGAGFLGALRSVVPLAAPQERASLMAAFYIESYLANAVPAMAAGYLAQQIGLEETAGIFGLFVLLLSVLAIVLAEQQRSGPKADQDRPKRY